VILCGGWLEALSLTLDHAELLAAEAPAAARYVSGGSDESR
jgi:hypothetical protein